MNRKQVRKEKDVLDRIIGENIRTEREVRNLSREELSEILGLTVGHMGLIERGERGATGVTLLKLSRSLDKPIDDFFRESKDAALLRKGSDTDNPESNHKKIASLATYLTAKELDFVINVTQSIIRLNHSHATDDKDFGMDEGDL